MSEAAGPLHPLAAQLQAVRDRVFEAVPAVWPELSAVLDLALPDPMDPHVALPLATARAWGASWPVAREAAAIWAIVAAGVRILDDCEDRDNPHALHERIPFAQAVNTGSGLLLLGTHLLAALDLDAAAARELMRAFTTMGLRAHAGQARDLAGGATTLSAYEALVGDKTACAFAFAAELGAVLASPDRASHQAARACGWEVGIMLQLLDDLEACFLPDGPSDYAQGKITWPIHLARQSPHLAARRLDALLAAGPAAEPDLRACLDELGIREQMIDRALAARERARAALSDAPHPEGRVILKLYLDWSLRDLDRLRAARPS